MAGIRSNILDVQTRIIKIATCLQLTRRRRSGKSLGEEALDLIRTETYERSKLDHKGPSEAPFWAPNAISTLRNPKKKGKPVGIMGDSDNMLSMDNLKGPTLIESGRAQEVVGGVSEEAQLKLEWFQDPFHGTDRMGRERNQPPRKIVGYDERTDKKLGKLFGNQLDETIQEVGG